MVIRTFDEGQPFYANAVRGLPDKIFYAPYLPASRFILDDSYTEGEAAWVLDISGNRYAAVSGLPDRDTIAILDSGIATDHPLLRPRIVAQQDFSGEGDVDLSGHGTMRALQTLLRHPTARFLVAKVVGEEGGSQHAFLTAMDWAIKNGAGLFYLALGEYNFLCRGGCPICRSAGRAIEEHRVVIAAPGNRYNRVACPSKAKGVTPTVATRWHQRRALSGILAKSDLSTVPAYFWYPGEQEKRLPVPDMLDALGLSSLHKTIGARLETYRSAFGSAQNAGPIVFSKFLDGVRDDFTRLLSGPLTAQIVALDEIWERVSERLLDELNRICALPKQLLPDSMWVPLYGIPEDYEIYATVPREVPPAGRHLIVHWEYAWSNLARLIGRGPHYQDFKDKAASHLEAYIARRPDDADAYYQLGVLHLMAASGNCRGPLTRAAELRPDWPALIAALQAAREYGFLEPELGTTSNRIQTQTLADAKAGFDHASALAKSMKTLDGAISEFRSAVAKFETMQKALETAVALTYLGANLVNRAWIPPNLVNIEDAVEAETVLTHAAILLSETGDPLESSLKANALAWRARARTFLAETDLRKNDLVDRI